MPPDELFTRDEALGGLPARRAATLLFLIESRTAYFADQSRRATDFFLSEDAAKERDLDFLEAFSLGREPPIRVTVQDIERFAAKWAPLVPDNPSIRAAIAHLLGQKYKFTERAVPGVRAALRLDDAVKQAYRRHYRLSLETIFAPQISFRDWLPWAWGVLSKWVDSLSPFWLTFGLTVAFSLSQAFLALPTGVAKMGPLPGVFLVIVIGLINVLTMACMTEACARSGDFRYGKAFIGRLVSDYLGAEASFLFSIITSLRTFLVMVAGSIGIGVTLAAVSGVPAELWVALLLVVELYYLSRKSASVTATTMLFLIATNLLLLLPIALLAFSQAQPANLLYMSLPFLQRESFDPSILKLVFGVIVMLYIGHVYVIQCAKIVLPRDPNARSLIRGSVAGTVFLTFLFAAWVLAFGGAVAPAMLASEASTALAPLAQRVGPSINVLGTFLVVLLLGMSCLRTSTVLFNMAREYIPTRLRSIVTLPRQRGSLLLRKRGVASNGPYFGLTYLGLSDGQPRFRLDVQLDGNLQRLEMTIAKHWDISAILERFRELRPHGISLGLEVVEAGPESARLQVSSAMNLWYEGDWAGPGLHLADVSTLRDPVRQLLNWVTRRGEVSLAEVTEHAGGNEQIARLMIEELLELGFVHTFEWAGGPRYRVHLASRHGRQVPHEIWQSLDATVGDPPQSGGILPKQGINLRALWFRRAMLNERARFFIAVSPVLVVFLIAEALFLTGTASFAGVLGFGGVIANSLTAGIFPVLLLFSSRRKGDYVPAVVYRFLDHPLFTASIYTLFLMNLFLHGLFIYRNPWARGVALFFGLAVIGMSVMMIRRRVFRRRSVVELREDAREGGKSVFTIISGGKPVAAGVELNFAHGEENCHSASGTLPSLSALRHAAFHLPMTDAGELKIWVHRVTPEGASEGLPAVVEVPSENGTRQFDLKLSGGQVVLPLTEREFSFRIVMPEPESP